MKHFDALSRMYVNPKMNVDECNERIKAAAILDDSDVDLNIRMTQCREIKFFADRLEIGEVNKGAQGQLQLYVASEMEETLFG